jgi:uncharacterized protein YkwD
LLLFASASIVSAKNLISKLKEARASVESSNQTETKNDEKKEDSKESLISTPPDQPKQSGQVVESNQVTSKQGVKPISNSKKVIQNQTPTRHRTRQQTPQSSLQTPRLAAAPVNSQISEILNWINAERKANGLNEVTLNGTLNQAAFNKSKHMSDNNYFAHTSPGGVGDIDFIKQSGYRYSAVGMNLAEGNFGSSKGLVDAWMNSSGHRQNILANFGKEIGIGIYGNYFSMFIARPQ